MRVIFYLAKLFILLLITPLVSFSQISSEIKPLQLNKNLIQNNRIKSVMGMFQLNSAGMEEEAEDYLPYKESYGSYERYKGEDFRKFLFFTSLGSFVQYNEEGKITSEVNIGEKKYTTYTYDAQNKLTRHREVDLNYPTSSDTELEITYTYDEHGNKTGYDNGAQVFTFTRNKKGEVTSWKVVEKEFRDPESKPNQGAPSGDKDISNQFQFDKKGREIREQNSPDYYTETTYSDNPSVTTRNSYEKGVLKLKTVHTLDPNGRPIKMEQYRERDGKIVLSYSSNNSYDENGNTLTQSSTIPSDPERSYELRFAIEYSKTGLPLRRKIYQNEVLLGTEIFYYEHY